MEKESLAVVRRVADERLQTYLRMQKVLAEREQEREQETRVCESLLTCQSLVQTVAQALQKEIHTKIADVVTQCLKIVFGDDAYEFGIKFEQKRGKTEAVLVFVRDGLEVDPLTASGGGVVDVAAFALRMAALALTRPAVRRVVVFDEPFRFVSRGYWPGLVQLIEYLGEVYGVQFIIVTHCPELRCGTVIEIEA